MVKSSVKRTIQETSANPFMLLFVCSFPPSTDDSRVSQSSQCKQVATKTPDFPNYTRKQNLNSGTVNCVLDSHPNLQKVRQVNPTRAKGNREYFFSFFSFRRTLVWLESVTSRSMGRPCWPHPSETVSTYRISFKLLWCERTNCCKRHLPQAPRRSCGRQSNGH